MSSVWSEEKMAENKAIQLLKKLGYTYVHGKELSPDHPKEERERYQEVFLKKRLRKAIRRINPWITDRNMELAVKELTNIQALDTTDANSQIHNKLVRHITVEQDLGSGKKGQTVKFIDFDHPENNDFLVTNQMKFAGPEENIIPDLLVYLNGIPVGVIECKSPTLKYPKEEAVKQLLRYQNAREPQTHEGHEKLFWANEIIVGSWGVSGVSATIGARYEHFKEWKDPYPATLPEIKDLIGRKPTKQDILLYSLLKKDRLLDLIQNFVVFEDKGGGTVKKIARYQQYRAVQKALERINEVERTDDSQRGGVVWHTQGSGKSLTMLFLATKLRRLKNNPVIIIVTDRKELDKQIVGTFKRCGFPNPKRAESIKELRQELNVDVGKTILTTIHKFQETDEIKSADLHITDSKNVYIMADEAHRTQYNQLANFMRTSLPNAFYIGFTGTPIEKKYRNIRDTFGHYIDKYTIDESVEDGVTVPIKYEGRLPNLWVEGSTIEQLFDRIFAKKSFVEREKIKSRYANMITIAESEERITQIVMDVLDHYEEHIAPNGFKAQVVAVSRRAAALYKTKIDELNGPECTVIYSGDHNDEYFLKQFHKKDTEISHLIDRFQKPLDEDPLAILIVCDMLITGFDAPIEQVMYLDKPLKEHNLLQAIARVNRPSSGKHYGLIVDYYGISGNLSDALDMFSKKDVQNALRPLEEELPRLETRHRKVMSFFDGVDLTDTEACLNILEPEDVRLKFDVAFRKFAISLDMLLPHPKANPYLPDLKLLGKIKQAASNMYRDSDIDISGCGQKVRELIDKYIRAEGVEHLQKEPVSILDENFEETVQQRKSAETKASEMEHAIRYEITVRLKENPVVYRSLKERLEELIEAKRQHRIELAQLIEEYGLLIQRIRSVYKGTEAKKMGMNDTEYAFYNIIAEEASECLKEDKAPNKEALKKLTQSLVSDLQDLAVIDFRKKRSVQKKMKAKIRRVLMSKGWEYEQLDSITTRIMELAEVRF